MELILLSIVIIIGLALQVWFRVRHRKYDGKIVIIEVGEKKTFSLELDMDPDEIASMSYITFKVTDELTEDLE